MNLLDFLSEENRLKNTRWLDDKSKQFHQFLNSAFPRNPKDQGHALQPVMGLMETLSPAIDIVDMQKSSGGLMDEVYGALNESGRASKINALGQGANLLASTISLGLPGNLVRTYDDLKKHIVANYDKFKNVKVEPFEIKLNPAQQQSQEIIDLLKSDKADQVTDQMLEKADSKYLFENYDLPMDTESRMARAKEMGLTEDAFHGTDYDFKKFSNTYPTFTSNEPAVAGTYTNKTSANMTDSRGQILPLRVLEPNKTLPYLEIEGAGDNWSDIRGSRSTYDPAIGIGEEDLHTIIGVRNPNLWESNAFGGYTTKEITHSNRNSEANLSGIIFDDIVDRGGAGYSHLSGNQKHNLPSRVRAEFNPENIRSRFARFDPRLKHLKNLSAGVIPIGLLPFLMGSNEDQY